MSLSLAVSWAPKPTCFGVSEINGSLVLAFEQNRKQHSIWLCIMALTFNSVNFGGVEFVSSFSYFLFNLHFIHKVRDIVGSHYTDFGYVNFQVLSLEFWAFLMSR